VYTPLFKHYLFAFMFCSLAFAVTIKAQPVPLTFQVDMSNENISPDGVHVAGNFQSEAGYDGDWNPGATQLTDEDNDSVYEITVMVPPGFYLYKFVNGNEWTDKPELPAADCATDDGVGNFNREVTVSSQGINLPVVVFDSCNAILHFSVDMNNEPVSDDGVHVMGDFQEAAGYPSNWSADAIRIEDVNNDGVYSARIPVAPGNYQYRFINGNTPEDAETPPSDCTADDGNGNFNRTITATVGYSQAITYCYNTCDICDPALNTDYATYWWNDAVFYEIFIRSFYDSDGDGIGDFQGVIEKLDYLNDGNPDTDTDLGITGIWLMPMMESPSYHGYDVTDYYATEPDYGTMEDFEALLDAAHERGIKVIIDYVMNHSSNQHPWFTQSANNQNGYRDWYVWSDNNPGFPGPWGQPVWHNWNGDYYYGLFWGGMPDLNFSHPPVKEEMFSIAEFWLDKGVDGFRLDAIKYLDEDGSTLENTPETFQLLEDFNILYKSNNPDAFTVGEVWSNTASILPYIQNDRLDVCFEFDLAYSIINAVNWNTPDPVYGHLQTVQAGYPKLQYATFLTNHDIDRIFSQFGGDDQKMKQAAALYLTLPGIPFIYYGEEVGMIGTGAHENIRRPMQWTDGLHAGFSTSTPWYGVGSNYTSYNVEDLEQDPNSIFSYYKQLIHLRNDYAPLRRGYLLPVGASDEQLLSYARIHEDEAVIVISNMGAQSATAAISMAVSTLPPGAYQVKELLSDTNWGSLTVNATGGFSNWQPPANAPLGSRESWVLWLSRDPSSSTSDQAGTDEEILLFPNPANDATLLQWAENNGQASYIELFAADGTVVFSDAFRGQSYSLDTSGFDAGIYFIRVNRGQFSKILKLIVL
jgi:alpha-amylase